jgi:hypothetical protein
LNECHLPFGPELSFSNFLSANLNIKIYRSIILPLVLYGCEIWSHTVREEHWLLKKIFGRKREEVTRMEKLA